MRTVKTRLKRLPQTTIIAIFPLSVWLLSFGGRADAQEPALPLNLPGAPAPSVPTQPPNFLPAATAGVPSNAGAVSASAPSVRVVVENGMRYQETRTMVRQPIQDVRYEDRQESGYQQRLRTDTQQVNYYTQVPITQYECVPRLYDWWRVLRGGYVAYGLEPYTTWQTQPQSTTVPVTRREVMPVQRTVKVAVPYLRFEEREQVTRVALGPVNGSVNGPAPGFVAGPPPPLTPSYIPPAYVPPRISPPGPGPGYIRPRTLFGSGIGSGNVAPGGSIAPYAPNPFGGWGVANGTRPNPTPPSGGILAPGPSFLPTAPAPNPSFSPSPSARVSPAPQPEIPLPSDKRYGGVARFDGDPPRYGTRPDFTR